VKVFVSVDLEGVAGVTDVQQLEHGRDSYEQARRLMTAEANAAIEGAFAGGAEAVVVSDSHHQARNLLVEELDPRATLVRGRFKPRRMLAGLDGSFGAALFVGYHGRAGAHPGVLNHTWLGEQVLDVRLNGESAGELRLNAAVAGELGVPVVLVTGDDVACAEAEALGTGVRTVTTKRALDRFAAELRHPHAVAEEIRSEAERTVAGRGEVKSLQLAAPVAVEVDWSSTHMATICALVPGVEQTDGRTSAYPAASMAEALDVFVVLTTLAAAVQQDW
jgi:D-amino peptidase